MSKVFGAIRRITNVTMYLGYITLVFMAVFLGTASILRSFGKPVLGDIEITSLTMVVLIFLAIPVTQAKNAHIQVGMFIDRLSWRSQKIMDIISSILTISVASLIAYVYYHTSVKYFITSPSFSDLLDIPLYPFKFVIFFSAVLWILVCIDKLVLTVSSLVKNEQIEKGED